MKFVPLVALAVAAGLTLSGCGAETRATSQGKPSADTSATATVPESPSDEPTVEEGQEPFELGEQVSLGDWDVTVTKVTRRADAQIKKANEFNGPAANGEYVLVDYEATYTGDERIADAAADLYWTLTTNDSQVLDPATVVTAADNANQPTTVRNGGTIRHVVVFDVDPALFDGALVGLQTQDADFNTIYADFQL